MPIQVILRVVVQGEFYHGESPDESLVVLLVLLLSFQEESERRVLWSGFIGGNDESL